MLMRKDESNEIIEEGSYKPSKKQRTKRYQIVLVAPNFIVYKDDNGYNRHIKMKYDGKIGDYIEI